MTRVIPHLWFQKDAAEAARRYISLFENSRMLYTRVLRGTPSGDVEIVGFELAGHPFQAIGAQSEFSLNPSFSLMVACDTEEEVNRLWEELKKDGEPLMDIGSYPFSKRYGWIQDRYGLSWQLILGVPGQYPARILPNLLFSGPVIGSAEEAIHYYADRFPDAGVDFVSRYALAMHPERQPSVNYAAFHIFGTSLTAMDNAVPVDYTFNEAASLVVRCETQEEIDRYWEALSAVPEAEACGWLKDRFGLSWQIVPEVLERLMSTTDEAKAGRVTKAFLSMKKFDIAALLLAAEETE